MCYHMLWMSEARFSRQAAAAANLQWCTACGAHRQEGVWEGRDHLLDSEQRQAEGLQLVHLQSEQRCCVRGQIGRLMLWSALLPMGGRVQNLVFIACQPLGCVDTQHHACEVCALSAVELP